MSAPTVDIVIASYNYCAYLGAAIESALAQTYRPVNVVVVDDGSTDDSLAIARRYPVTVLAQEHQGVGGARNAGARHSSGDYLMFLDADDVLDRTYVERCVELLRAAPPSVAYVYTQMRLFGAQTGFFESRPFDRRVLLRGNYVNASALMRRAAFVEAGGYDTTWQRAYEDHELWVRMLSLGYTGRFLPEPLLNYRRHARSRNTLDRDELAAVRWRLRGAYPRLYLRYFLLRPLKFLWWIWRARQMNGRLRAATPAVRAPEPGAG